MTAGRPSKYDPSFIAEADKYIKESQDEEVQELVGLSAKGTELYKKKLKVNIPTIESFAVRLGVNKTTLYEWAKDNEEFSNALSRIKTEQQKRLMNSGLSGDYNPTIAKLVLSANHDMREKSDVTSDEKPIGKPIENAIEKVYGISNSTGASSPDGESGGSA